MIAGRVFVEHPTIPGAQYVFSRASIGPVVGRLLDIVFDPDVDEADSISALRQLRENGVAFESVEIASEAKGSEPAPTGFLALARFRQRWISSKS